MTAIEDGHGAMTERGFRHEALLYAGDDGFLDGTLPFILAAVAAEEPILVVVGAEKIERLRAELGADAGQVSFADMSLVGTNPARIIPAWREFVSARAVSGSRLRGIGEPIWAGRSAAELVECQRHEALLNLAFAGAADFWLLCPYDTGALEAAVIEKSHHSHPVVVQDGAQRESAGYLGLAAVAAPFADPLPDPPPGAAELAYEAATLSVVRALVAARAAAAGLDDLRAGDLVLAINELATNSVRHAGGHGVLRVWQDDGALICEVRDGGRIDHPMAGRERPASGQPGGHGLWLVNQLCDLVQVRSFAHGSAVRLHMRRA